MRLNGPMSAKRRQPKGLAHAATEISGSARPTQIGRYVLCHEIGSGGMATVYLARIEGAAGFEKLVALKMIHPHLAKEKTFVDMFLDEARIASKINHSNVCSVFDFGEEAGTYYMAMEYLAGEPLFRVVNTIVERNRPEDLRVLPYYAARIIADAAEGLHAAHELHSSDGQHLGIVHRDVSPQNLFITFDGSVQIVDFGCAQAIQRVSQTEKGLLKGKVAYAAPEQIKVRPVDRRADVWALGICLWETLTLRQLFRRDTDIHTVMAVLEDPIPLASEVGDWVPLDLAKIAQRALQRSPENRYQAARELGRDLRRWIASSGHSVEAAELAEWMGRLFPGERERHGRLMEDAREGMNVSEVARVTRPDSPGTLRVEKADSEPSRPRTRSRGWALPASIVLLLGALVGGGWWAWYTHRLDAWLESGEPTAAVSEAHPVAGAEPRRPTRVTPAEPEDPPSQPDMVLGAEDVEPPPVVEATEPDPGREPERGGPVTTVAVAARHGPEPTGSVRAPTTTTAMTEFVVDPASDDVAPRTGAVRIQAVGGWSEVLQGGRSVGRTPLTLELPAGQHQLTLLPFGQEPGTLHTVRVVPGVLVTLSASIRDSRDPESAPSPDPAP